MSDCQGKAERDPAINYENDRDHTGLHEKARGAGRRGKMVVSLGQYVVLLLLARYCTFHADGFRGLLSGPPSRLHAIGEEGSEVGDESYSQGGLVNKLMSRIDALERRLADFEEKDRRLTHEDDSEGRLSSFENIERNLAKYKYFERRFADLQENVTRSVAFYAKTNKDPLNVGSQNIVILNNVITNVGNAYDGNTGIFNVPYNGMYFLTWSVMNAPDHDAYVYLTVDGRTVSTDYVAHKYVMATASLTLRLTARQTVYLVNGQDTQLRGGDYTSFSGFLIRAE